MGFEPTISCLGSMRSTTELHPLGYCFGLYATLKMHVKPDGEKPHLSQPVTASD